VLNRYVFFSSSSTIWFTICLNFPRPWFSETKRVGATEAPSNVCSGLWTIRLSSCCEVLTGSAVTKGRSPIGHPILGLGAVCLSVCLSAVHLDLFRCRLFLHYKVSESRRYSQSRLISFPSSYPPPIPFPVSCRQFFWVPFSLSSFSLIPSHTLF